MPADHAGLTARWAARSTAWSAADAKSAAYQEMADKLIELLAEAK